MNDPDNALVVSPLQPQPAPLTDATLIFNTKAGGSETASPESLSAALMLIGYQPVYRATDSEEDLRDALSDISGTVFVAGGDGTIRAAALYLAGKPDVTLGVIPMGTANNIGRMLGIQGQPLDVIDAYQGAQVLPFDMGIIRAPWGEDYFLEACGCGAFAEVIAEYDPEEGKSPLRAVQAIGSTITTFKPFPMQLGIDGVAHPEADYALLEVMNTKATGPRLRMATHADPHDGLLDVIAIDAGEREGVLAYLAALARDDFAELPSVQCQTARQIEIPYLGQAFHIDGEIRPPQETGGGSVQIEVWPAALHVLVPTPKETP